MHLFLNRLPLIQAQQLYIVVVLRFSLYKTFLNITNNVYLNPYYARTIVSS